MTIVRSGATIMTIVRGLLSGKVIATSRVMNVAMISREAMLFCTQK